MKELYDQIDKKLDIINFESIWKGFHRYEFAIYTSKKVQFKNKEIPWDTCFIGNTSIKYNGNYIAIWNVEQYYMNNENKDMDILVANITHEMFHAYQYENREKRFPQDLVTLNYPYNVGNYNLKYEENKLLADAFEIKDLIKKKELLNYFCGIRQCREAIIGKMCECEYLTETAEGMAEYAGLCALKMLSESKYTSKTKDFIKILGIISPSQLDIRRISYYIGAILLLAANDAKINFTHSISEEDETIFRIISRSLSPRLKNFSHYDYRIKSVMEEVEISRKLEIDLFMQGRRLKQDGDFYINGYDPMNMIKVGKYILCKTFVRLINASTNQTVELMGKTLLEMQGKHINKANCYYR